MLHGSDMPVSQLIDTMKNRPRLQFSLIICSLAQLTPARYTDYSKYVNPFIGSEGPFPGLAFGGGDIFVGGALPFGVVKLGIDTYEQNVSFSTINGGYTPNGLVTAITMMHESGTGGGPKYGIVPQMPLTSIGGNVNLLDNRTYWQERVGRDNASVGFFGTKLKSGVNIQLSASRHAGIMQYSFPTAEKHVLVDVSHYLPSETGGSDCQFYAGGEISLHDGGRTYKGYTTNGGGFSESAPSTVYFCGEFSEAPAQAKTFRGRLTDPVQRQHSFADEPIPHPTFRGRDIESSGGLNDRVGAVFTWSNASSSTVKSKVGISFISAEKACTFKNKELPSWHIHDTVEAARYEWNKDVFSKIEVPLDKSQNLTKIRLLYSSLYFMHLMPSDRTGENPLWESDEPSWDDWYTMWDIFR
nr:putative secreted glycosidase [Quercus suber]